MRGIGCAAPCLLAAALLLTGCQAQVTQISEHLPPPPAAELGPQFEVLKAPRYSYIISETVDNAGRVHLIAVPRRGHEGRPVVIGSKVVDFKELYPARHLVIGPQGVESSEIIRKGVNADSVDLAFDRAGNLHALIDDEHLMKQGGQWVGGLRTPWKEANLESFSHSLGRFSYASTTPAFVKGMPDLTWTFSMSSGDRNWPGRVEWTAGMGGFPVPLPSSEQAGKQIVVPEETPYRHWYALGTEDGLDVIAATESGDGQNRLHALYQGKNEALTMLIT
jgi:hypothetical protein